MKAFTSFWAGAIAGYLVGSSKQGIKLRANLEDFVHGFSSKVLDCEELASENLEEGSGWNESEDQGLEDNESDQSDEGKEKGLQLEKALELAEKLGAKVSEPEGEAAIPHAHPIETSTSRLSA